MELAEIPDGLTDRQQLTYLTGQAAATRVQLINALRNTAADVIGASPFDQSIKDMKWTDAHEIVMRVLAQQELDPAVRSAVEDAVGATYTALSDLTRLVDRLWVPLDTDNRTWVHMSFGEFEGDTQAGFQNENAESFVAAITAAQNLWARLMPIGFVLPRFNGEPAFPDHVEQNLRMIRGEDIPSDGARGADD